MRFSEWEAEWEPRLGDVIAQESARGALDHDRVRRAYEVVGVEETRTGWRLVCERIEYRDPTWTFYSRPRSS